MTRGIVYAFDYRKRLTTLPFCTPAFEPMKGKRVRCTLSVMETERRRTPKGDGFLVVREFLPLEKMAARAYEVK